MDITTFVGDITEWELKKRLDLKIQKLQKQIAEKGCSDFEFSNNKDSVDDLLNNLAYRCVVCDLSDSEIKSEIEKIMDEILQISKLSEEVLDESIQLDESFSTEQSCSNSNDSFNFNDTMEEMERLLRDGLVSGNDNIEDDKYVADSSPETMSKSQESNINFKEVDQNMSAIEVEQFSCDFSKNFENEQYSPQSVNSEESIKSKKTTDVNHLPFKLPVSSYKKQILNSGGNKPQCKTSNPVNKLYKHITSPVAFYIKNSGITPRRQHLKFTPEKHLSRNDMSESVYSESITNNQFPQAKDIILPEVFYLPAAMKIVSQEHHTKLPNSINKLVGNMPEIIIHEHRIRKGERKLNMHTANPNNSVANEDISIYTTKQAEIQ
ncbi:uncharacterized protein LOC108739389 [Agrilus planipennis]|uniref:Uncharacterized protein LOC108739389 n=1 Tax=Agrilus planipennis TaxID=224129 RepID=A0A1W4WY18_AGRPL|nr:uncharacterized protein LOC108739389 [Agrilus planipennis]